MKIVGVVFFVLYSFTVSAQEFRQLTFQEAVKLGIKNNIDLKQEHNNLIGAKSNNTASIVNYTAPTISGFGNVGRDIGNSFSEQLGILQGKFDNISGSISVNYTLFNGLNRFYSMKQRKLLEESQMHTVQWTRETVINNIALQYLNALLGQELLSIAENNLQLQVEQLNKIKYQVELGSIAEIQKVNQVYQVKNAELQVLRAKADLRNRKATLLQILLIDPTVQVTLIEPNWDVQMVIGGDLNTSELIQMAVEQRADFKQSVDRETAFKNAVKAAKGFYFPSLTAYFGYGSAYNYVHPTKAHPTPVNRVFNDQFFEDNIREGYGIRLTLSILNGFSVRNNVVQNKINYENSKLANEALLNTIKSEVLNAYEDYEAAILDFEASQSQLEAAELSFTLEKESFELGASDFIQYREANQNLVSAQADYARAFYTLAFQEIFLKYATGTLQLEDIPQ